MISPVFAGSSPAPTGLAEVRDLERYAGHTAVAAEELQLVAQGVADDGRLHSLQRLSDRHAALARAALDVERALERYEAAFTLAGAPADEAAAP